MSRHIHIIVCDPSVIVVEGMTSIFQKSGQGIEVSHAETFEEVRHIQARKRTHLVLLNPSLVQNSEKEFSSLRTELVDIRWIGLVFAYYDQHILGLFDGIISINDTPENIHSEIQKVLEKDLPRHVLVENVLSEREIEVLKLLTKGLANKEVANELNISINTVITHRKNISQKTGIKSISGLTIYAVVQKLIEIESLT